MQRIYDKTNSRLIVEAVYPHHSAKVSFLSLKFNGKISYNIKNILQKYDIKTVFRSNPKLGSSLMNSKSKTNEIEKCGVYRVTCGDCGCFYVGQTGRNLDVRLKQHLKDRNSNIFKHIKEKKHVIDASNIKLLHEVSKSRKLNLLEDYEILSRHREAPDLILNSMATVNDRHLFIELLNP